MTNPTIVFPVKMEYGWNLRISGLKMTVKSGLEKIFLHAQSIFQTYWLTLKKGGYLAQIANSLTKMTLFAHGEISKKILVV